MLRIATSVGLMTALATQAWSSDSHNHVTMINGKPLPVEPYPLQDVTVMLDTVDSTGNRLVITKGTRMAGTRAVIHIHEYGGHTCVMNGEITIYMEGSEPAKKLGGTCYYMPPNVHMSATNLGQEDVVLIDTFTLPPKVDTLTPLEEYPGD